MKQNNLIRSYPFTGYDSEQIKRIGNRVGFLYHSDGSFDVYFCERNVDGEVKGVLCYFKFLTDIISKFENKSYSVNTYLDTILMCINEFISGYKKNGCFRCGDILFSLSRSDLKLCDYRYLSCIIETLMSDSYLVDVYGTDTCVKYEEVSDGNLSDVVSYVFDNAYGFDVSDFKCKVKNSIKACL